MVQRDGAERRFMWGQCRRENPATGAQRGSPDFCCSSQDYVDRRGAKLQINLSGKQTHGGGGAPRSVRLRSFIIPPVFQERDPGRVKKEQRTSFKCSLRERNAVLIPADRRWAKWVINKLPPRVRCTDDNFVSFFLPPKLYLPPPLFTTLSS